MPFNAVLNFWFSEISPKQWWKKDKFFDQLLINRFLNYHILAVENKLINWRSLSKGRLAEIILIDQFSRNIYRNKPDAFKCDYLALELARDLLFLGLHEKLNKFEKVFAFMPFMYSENINDQIIFLNLFGELNLIENFRSALKHFIIIRKFNRFPHRNKILNRISTVEEINFLKSTGNSF